MTRQRWPACAAIAGFTTVGVAGLLALAGKGLIQVPLVPAALVAERSVSTPAIAQVPAPADRTAVDMKPATASADAEPTTASTPAAQAGYYAQLRSRLRWVQTRVDGDTLLTPDLRSRMMLAKSAAQRAGLREVGLSFKDVYGLIDAESSWVPRRGSSKDGTPNLGIAQFEPATAKALGLRDPQDPVEAVHVAAVHMKHAALWSAERLQGLKLGAGERAEKLREGVSVYYNLSVRGRNAWNGRNTNRLPRETQRHIQNARLGAQEAALLEARLQPADRQAGEQAVATAGADPNGS